MTAIIFAGPSLPPSARPDLPGLAWRPPARQGDLYRAALARPAVIGLLDGVFEVVPTVWHKEILWAMTQGIAVYGAASLGALRAAELDAFGMLGVGRVYQDFRDGVLEDDDEVALLHGPAETDYAPVTEAMVNIRETVRIGIESGLLAPADAAILVRDAKALFYKTRTWAAIIGRTDRASLRDAASRLAATRVDLKQADAHAMVAAVAAHLSTAAPPPPASFRFAHTALWESARHSPSPPRTPPLPHRGRGPG